MSGSCMRRKEFVMPCCLRRHLTARRMIKRAAPVIWGACLPGYTIYPTGRSFRYPGRPLICASNIRPFLADREQDFSFLKESAEKLAGYIKGKLPETAPVYGFCHGDVHSGNVFFAGDKPTLFDLDCMGYGWRAYDICVYAWNETFLDENYIEGSVWKKYLEGYESVRPLSAEEKETIPAFAALRQLWLMGLHADVMDRNAGCCWYQDDYFDSQIKMFRLWLDRCSL